jgi:type I restriction enzyme S subunit
VSAELEEAQPMRPVGCYWTTMGDIAEVVGGGTPRTNDPTNFEAGDVPWVTPADLSGYREKFIAHGARFITRKGLESSSARLLPAGAVLFTSRAPVGYVAIARNPVATNQGFKSFVLKDCVLPEYVYWWLKGSKQRAEALASGTTFLELSGANAKKLPIPIRSVDEQRRIVAEIEKQFSRLDEAVANLKRVKANLDRLHEATIQAALAAAGRDSPIRPAAELFQWSSGVNLPASKQHGGSVPVYGGNGIAGYHSEGNVDQATVVIGRVGAGCGNVHLVREPAWVTDNAIYATQVAESVSLPYAALIFKAAKLNGRAAGSGQPFVNQRMLNEVMVPLPSLAEQGRIDAEVDRWMSGTRALESQLNVHLARANGLRRAIFAKEFCKNSPAGGHA